VSCLVSNRLWTIDVLGDLCVTCDGEPFSVRGADSQRTLAVLVLVGTDGARPETLHGLLDDHAERMPLNTLHQRLSSLRGRGLPVSRLGRDGIYRIDLSGHEVTVDAWEFARQAQDLTSAGEPVAIVRRLLSLWRGNPFTLWRVPESQTLLERPRAQLTGVVDELAERHVDIPELGAFARHFPGDVRLAQLARQARRGKLLVVEDQLLDELVGLLKKDYDVLAVPSYRAWEAVRHRPEFFEVTGAIIDRHLEAAPDGSPRGDQSGLEVARYLRDNTRVRPVLLSVDVDASHRHTGNLIEEYRLLDVVRKESHGSLDVAGIREAARLVMHPDAKARMTWVARCLDTAMWQAHAEFGSGEIGRARVERRAREANGIRELLRQEALEEATEALDRFLSHPW